MAKFDKERKRTTLPPGPPVDPDVLARTYMEKAGYPVADLDAVTPVLREAGRKVTLEKQMSTAPSLERPWTK